MKTCSKCKIEKPFEAFQKNKNAKDGHSSSCKECKKLRYLELKKNPLMQLEKQIRSSVILENKLLKRENKKLCYRCKEVFLIEDLISGIICKECSRKKDKEDCEKYKEKRKEYRKEFYKEYYKKNKEYRDKKNKEYKDKNKEKMKGYYEKNKEKIKEYIKKYNEKNKEKIKEYKREYQRQYRLKKKLERLQNNDTQT